ncbi:Flagellar M-ring protein FliF [Methylophaga thiooxydans]|uniref:Flagellar M-ring protein n=1 Tax=Methylophaga thiooxydans TaxID=392484 RepID=A0A0A0BKN0_9GAMM|nr:flagellar basal-body MS-ring/collar protein FliF [Methylophaga thiooxydans]KGM08202.1 Flagellar M-ring protein FliF [Methylophaga thiooxydans]
MENVPATTANQANMNAPRPTTPLAMMQNNVSRQPIVKQILFLVAIAASIAVGGYVLMWSQTPSYQVLFANMAPQESSQVVDVLQQMNVNYKLDPATGALMVPAGDVQSLRMKLAAEGLPRSTSQGMEMLNEEQGFGTSQFIERARYQRAMEEELSRSIAELNNVRSARVHLAIPKQSVFVRNRKDPTASVVVNLFSGRALERGQVAAITHMVASSVPNMTNSHVTVVDQRGNLLTQPEREAGMAMSDSQLEYTQKVEQIYISRIEDILTPIVGMNGVRAQVVAEVDFTMTEQTHESYNPDMAAIRSEQVQEERRVGGAGPVGIPGALSNQPPGGGVAPEQTTEADEGGTLAPAPSPTNSSKSATRNFELDRTISHTRVAPGNVRKLSVAVLVDERRSTDAEGNVVSTPMTEAELTRINALVMDAIGFSKARGDSLNIVNAPFMAPEALEPLPEKPIWEQAWVWTVAKQVAGALVVLFLILGVIRPAFRDMAKVPANTGNQGAGGMTAQQAMPNNSAGVSGEDIAKLTKGSDQMEEQMTNVRSLVQQDPALVAQVVKNWTAGEA